MGFAETFKALSDPARRRILELLKDGRPARRRILELLKDGRLSAGDISRHFDMTQATVSYHLKILKQADLIREKREKNFIFYEKGET